MTDEYKITVMKNIQLLIIFALISLPLFGCSNTPYRSTSEQRLSSPENNDPVIRTKLTTQYRDWKGVPYKYGGMSKRGIDCSGFVYITYKKQFDVKLPRSTIKQSKTGTHIPQWKLTAGDLVFFKTGIVKKHVGIYLGNRKFLHASTSKGVTISSMDNIYWRKKYWKAQRIH